MEYPEDIEIQKLNEQYQRIASAVADTQGAAIEAGERLPELKKQLGEVILRASLGEAGNADVNAARFAVLNTEREIEAGDLIIEPARRAHARINGERNKLTRKLGYRHGLDELKNKITESGSATETEVARLRDLAATLAVDSAEIDAFLASLAPQAA